MAGIFENIKLKIIIAVIEIILSTAWFLLSIIAMLEYNRVFYLNKKNLDWLFLAEMNFAILGIVTAVLLLLNNLSLRYNVLIFIGTLVLAFIFGLLFV
jgi:hypothetical protein